MQNRLYQDQNPWISFQFGLKEDRLWMLLGEAFSKCQHLAGTPLQPALAQNLASIILTKGALATTAIEGNTLNEAEANAILQEGKRLPPSQNYLERGLRNVAAALEAIDRSARIGSEFSMTSEWIREQNLRIMSGLEVEDHVVPGEYTERQLVVGAYRAAPPEDVPYLVDRLCEWINGVLKPLANEDTPPNVRFQLSFFAAVLSHLYVAWIHPFGDGNGRTARLIECAILAHSGVVPWISSNVLSDHYNRTRTNYYRRLSAASRDGDVVGFLKYSAEGFVDLLREQISQVRSMQRETAWNNYVYRAFSDEAAGPTRERRIEVALSLHELKPTPRRDFRKLNTGLAEAYAGKQDKTIARDISALTRMRLIRSRVGTVETAEGRKRSVSGHVANIQIMDAFLPIASKWAPS